MKNLKSLLLLVAVLLLAGCELLDPLPTTTETLSISFTNETRQTLHLSFESLNRNAYWPGGGQVYILYPGESQDYHLSCRTTEKICWGASPANNYSYGWGSGADNSQGCEGCCYQCQTVTVRGQTLRN